MMKKWLSCHLPELAIFSLAFLIRFIFSFHFHPIQNYIFSDMNSYLEISNQLSHQEQSSFNTFFPIGYPLVLSVITFIAPTLFFPIITVFQILLGLGSIALLFGISREFLPRKSRLIFLAILAIYYPWIDFGGYLMSETLATFLLVLMVYLVFFRPKRHNLLWLFFLPLSIALATLVRSNLLLTGALIAIWLVYIYMHAKHIYSRRLIWRGFIVCICGSALSVIITSSIYGFFGKPGALLSTNGGLNFTQGQCLYRVVTDSDGRIFSPPVFFQRNIVGEKVFDTPFANASYFYLHGLNCLLSNPERIPGKFIELYYLFFDNIAWPSANQAGFNLAMKISHSFFNILILPGFFVSIILLFTRFKELVKTKTSLLYICAIAPLITAVIYYADIRYRLPFDGFIILLSLWTYQRLYLSRNSFK